MFGKLLFTGILSPHGKYPYKLKSKGVLVNFKSDFYENTHCEFTCKTRRYGKIDM